MAPLAASIDSRLTSSCSFTLSLAAPTNSTLRSAGRRRPSSEGGELHFTLLQARRDLPQPTSISIDVCLRAHPPTGCPCVWPSFVGRRACVRAGAPVSTQHRPPPRLPSASSTLSDHDPSLTTSNDTLMHATARLLKDLAPLRVDPKMLPCRGTAARGKTTGRPGVA